ncbi:MAG TPA: hypothetical protein VKB87_10575 [Myxococcaceae bacterium]|nr:hypothetical protein [Myxococcaceae bacterium]
MRGTSIGRYVLGRKPFAAHVFEKDRSLLVPRFGFYILYSLG